MTDLKTDIRRSWQVTCSTAESHLQDDLIDADATGTKNENLAFAATDGIRPIAHDGVVHLSSAGSVLFKVMCSWYIVLGLVVGTIA